MTTVIYITPQYDCEYHIDELAKMPKGELMTYAKNNNDIEIYSLKSFEEAFNNEIISDLGYILFVED